MKTLALVLLSFGCGCFLVLVAAGMSPVKDLRMRTVRGRAPQEIGTYIASHKVRKLQIGSGDNSLSGWLNTEIEPTKDQVYLDASTAFPIPSDSFDYIFAEQLIEHLTLDQGQGMLRECYRILRTGGKIRLATPNLTVLAKFFVDKNDSDRHYLGLQTKFEKLPSLPTPECNVMNREMHAYGHRYLYDADSLRAVLSAAGFQNVEMAEVSVSKDPALSGIDGHARAIASFGASLKDADEMNRHITMVVEASK